MIGIENKDKIRKGYICTFLHQYELYKEYCIIDDNRFLIICHEIYNNLHCENTFETTNESNKLNKKFPDAIDKYIISESMIDKQNIINTITQKITVKINATTPIIFLFEGHGPIKDPNTEGNLILSNKINLTTDDLCDIFNNYKINKKLFLFTQCGSFGFYNNLIINGKFANSSYIIITGINTAGMCALGARVLIKFSDLIRSNIYRTFTLLKPEIETNTLFTLQISENNKNLLIEDIFYKYKPIPLVEEIAKLSTVKGSLLQGGEQRISEYKNIDLELELEFILREIVQYITNIQEEIEDNELVTTLLNNIGNINIDDIIIKYTNVLRDIQNDNILENKDYIITFITNILPLLVKYKHFTEELKNLPGGNKPNTFIEINKVYEYYYNITNNNNIIELSKIFSNYEIIYLLLLIINSNEDDNDDIFKTFFINLQRSLDKFYECDVLLINHYNDDEIIYYIFINYIYDIYKSLLQKSSRDIYIIIKNDKLKLKTVENYKKIYNTLNILFRNPNKEFIAFLKKNLTLNETYEKTRDSKYLLTFIYKYSKLDDIFIKGYDSFLTYMYLNILYKFNNKISINYKKFENNIPSLYIYNFSDLKDKKYEFELTSKQYKMAEEILNDKRKLLIILGERYDDYSKQRINRINTNFTITAEILEYLNLLNGDKIFEEYKSLPIIDYNSYCEEEDEDNEEDIISNIIKYASYLYRNDLTAKEYSKLVKYYLLGLRERLGSTILNFGYEMIYMMSEKIEKTEIENNLIRELSKSHIEIEIGEINKYKRPENRKLKINILEILNYYYDKIKYKTMITYLSQLYKYDINNKFQNKIQDLLYKSKIYGGDITSLDNKVEVLKHKSTEDAVKILLNDEIIKALEKTNKNINDLIKKSEEAEKSEDKLKIGAPIYIFKPTGIDSNKINDVIFNSYEDYEDTTKFNTKSGLLTSLSMQSDEQKQGNPTTITIKGQLQSKMKDIAKIDKDIRTDLNKFLEEQLDDKGNKIPNKKGKYIEELNTLLQPIEDLLVTIQKSPELQSYPLLKRINVDYNKYKDDNDNVDIQDHPLKIRDDFISCNKEVLQNNLEKTKLLLSRYEQMIESFNSILSNKQFINRNNGNNGIIGGRINKIKKQGGVNNNSDLITKIKKLKANDSLNNFIINLKKLKGNRDIKNNVEKTLATPNFIDGEGLNLFDRLLESYDNDYKNKDIPHEITKNKFYNKVKNLNLDPEEELKITLNDKIVFAVVIFVIRIIALNICYYIIDKDHVTNIRNILISYILWYVIIFVILIFIINIDTFKLRILVNYMNLHINSFNLLIHILLMGGFIYLIYVLIYNIDGYDEPKIELTDNEKIKLKYKLDLLTIFIYIFICILLFII